MMIGISKPHLILVVIFTATALAIDLVVTPTFHLHGLNLAITIIWSLVAIVSGAVILAIIVMRIYEIARARRFALRNVDKLRLHIARLLEPGKPATIQMSATDGERGMALVRLEDVVEAIFLVRGHPEREAAIRSFFREREIYPNYDEFSGSERLLTYPVHGDATTLAALTQRILVELCGISPKETIRISY